MKAKERTPVVGTEQLTVEQLCAELQVARSTFYQWRQLGRGSALRPAPERCDPGPPG